jgi:hypothetical protein
VKGNAPGGEKGVVSGAQRRFRGFQLDASVIKHAFSIGGGMLVT